MPMPRTSATSVPHAGEQRREVVDEPRQDDVGTGGDVELVGLLDEDVAGEVGDRQPAVGGAEVGGQHDAGGGVEHQPGRRPAAGGRTVAPLGQQPELEQCVDPLGDGRPRQPGEPGDVGPRARPTAADQLEQRARTRPDGSPRSHRLRRNTADFVRSMTKVGNLLLVCRTSPF